MRNKKQKQKKKHNFIQFRNFYIALEITHRVKTLAQLAAEVKKLFSNYSSDKELILVTYDELNGIKANHLYLQMDK
jgi:hypothetical protein